MRFMRGRIKLLFCLMLCAGLPCVGWLIYSGLRVLPAVSTAALRPVPPTSIYDADGGLIAQLGDKKMIPVRLSQVPPVVKNAFLAAGDVRFIQKRGSESGFTARAVRYVLSALNFWRGDGSMAGLLVESVFPRSDRSLKGKVQEILLGLELEHRYTGDELLEMYLNRIYLGDGAYGIGAAARVYFNKDVSRLTLPEAALLAGLPQAPSACPPFSHPRAAKERRNEILGKMFADKLITRQQYEQALASGIDLHPAPEATHVYPYFVDYVTGRLIERFGEDAVYRGGLKVYTTLDPAVQQALQTAFADPADFPPSWRDAGGVLQPEGAAVFLSPQDGAVLAMVGGREYRAGGLNRAVQSYRQPGSAIEPFVVFGPAIQYNGMTPDSVVGDEPVNSGSNNNPVPVTLRTAMVQSIDGCDETLLARVGISRAVQFARGVGITSLDPDREEMRMALGGLYKGVTPLEMAGAYGAVANGGMYVRPHVLSKVVGADGSLLYRAGPEMHLAMDPYTAAALTSMMETGVQKETGGHARDYGRPVAGITGTADHGRDLWFCGFTPQLAGVVWIGCDQPGNVPAQYDGMHAAEIFRRVLSSALAGQPIIDFRSLYSADIYPPPELPSENGAASWHVAGTGGYSRLSSVPPVPGGNAPVSAGEPPSRKSTPGRNGNSAVNPPAEEQKANENYLPMAKPGRMPPDGESEVRIIFIGN